MMNLKKDAAYSLLVPTSMGVRLTPMDGQPFHCSDLFKMQVTSAETNVASVASFLGLKVKVLTAFVKDSPVARMIKDNLAGRHMDYEGKEFEQGGPWGLRHQFNLADSGFGSRGPRVQNDRAGEVGRLLNVKDFDLDRIFGKEGVKMVHMSGLVAALSPESSKFCLEIARTAKKYGSLISFDLNYRASFWVGREEELGATFAEIASLSDVLIGNEEDFQLCLKIKGPEAGGKGIAEKIDSFKEMVERVRAAYPNATAFATTLRQVVNANNHLWGAIANVDGSCIYLAVSVLFLARLCGVEIFGTGLIPVMLTVFILSLGSPISPGTVNVCLVVLMGQMGVSIAAIGLIMGINSIVEMFLSASNVVGDVAVSLAVASSEDMLDKEVFNSTPRKR